MRVTDIAFNDITQHLKEQKVVVMDGYKDVWIVTPYHLQNKKTRALNRQLGIKNINYSRSKNGDSTHR